MYVCFRCDCSLSLWLEVMSFLDQAVNVCFKLFFQIGFSFSKLDFLKYIFYHEFIKFCIFKMRSFIFNFLPVKMTSLRSRDIKLSSTSDVALFCENTGLTIKRKLKKVRY